MAFSLKKKKKHPVHHTTETERRERAYEKAHNSIQSGLELLGSGDLKGSTSELFHASRAFFGEFLPIHYQFTFEDLCKEVGKKHVSQSIKEKVDSFSQQITDAEYDPNGVPSHLLEDLYKTFGEITRDLKDELIVPKKKQEHYKVVEKISQALVETINHESANYEHIKALLSLADEQVHKNDLMGARESYVEIARLFDALSDESKAKLHDSVISFYNKLLQIH